MPLPLALTFSNRGATQCLDIVAKNDQWLVFGDFNSNFHQRLANTTPNVPLARGY
jgi:hypothetical protein